jgi:hypothetical protein
VAEKMNGLIKAVSLLLPHGVYVPVHEWWINRLAALKPTEDLMMIPAAVLKKNDVLFKCNQGKRCFILGNGPSAKMLDLAALKNEVVISVSNGYLHESYSTFAPRYHCLPQISYGRMTREDVVAWFSEMHEHLGKAELFLTETEAELVREYELFPGRTIHYIVLRESFDELNNRSVIDISQPIPRVESVPILAMMIAMYMGFRTIYLLGVDHDHFKTGNYSYAFPLGVQEGKDFSVTANGTVLTSRHDDFQSLARLWRQYRVLREIAGENGISVINATPGGELDEFPRMSFESIIKDKCDAI